MNVLSLFDGMSCGQIAINKLGVKYDKYYASEIETNPIAVTKYNYPNTIHLGDVRNLDVSKLDKIDLLIGGSPCQSFSFAGKMNGASTKCKKEITTLKQYLKYKKEGYEFEGQSYLFWEYVRILKDIQKINPNVIFLLENVVMIKKWEDIITQTLKRKPILIDSALVSAQMRKRLYWTNINNIEQPKDKNILLENILEDKSMLNKAAIVGRRFNIDGKRKDLDKSLPITQCLEVRATNLGKANCLTTVGKDNVLSSLPIGRYKDAYKNKLPYRNYTPLECERLQTVPDNYTKFGLVNGKVIEIAKSPRNHMLGNGWTVDVIVHILNHYFKI